MGRSVTVGSFSGILAFTFTAANQDGGVLLSCNTILAGAIGGSSTRVGQAGQLTPGHKSLLFQLVPGDMSAGSIEIDGTIDMATSQGLGSAWEPIPAPSTASTDQFSWFNPLSFNAGQRCLKVDSLWTAFRAQSSQDFVGSGAKLLIMAAT